MATICRSKLFKVLAVAMVVTVLQTPSAQAQQCDKNKTHTCCSKYSRCPSGYFMVSQCDTSSSATSVPSTTLPDDDTFNSTASSNDTSTDSSNDTSTESSIDTSTDSSNDTSTDAATLEASSTNDNGGTSSSSTPTVYCRRCKDNCSNCSDTVCFTCEAKFSLKNGKCVPSSASEHFPVAAVAGGVVGGVVLIVAAVVVIACVCRRKRQDPAQSPTVDDNPDTPDPSSDVESGVSEGEHNLHMSPDYANMGTKLKDMPTQILRGQDNVLRYTKDPTQPKQVIVPEEHESTYANQATIKLNQMAQAQSQEQQELQQLPTAPGPPRGVQPSKKQKKKKKKSLKAKDQETAQVHPPPEETSEDIYVNAPSTGGGSWEHDEEQIYENETSSPYVNYGFQNKM